MQEDNGQKRDDDVEKEAVSGFYPVLPLRDIVVFPHMIVPLFVGREKSVRALEIAMHEDRQILLATQKNAGDDDAPDDEIPDLGDDEDVDLGDDDNDAFLPADEEDDDEDVSGFIGGSKPHHDDEQ